jgi:hypothetical protein
MKRLLLCAVALGGLATMMYREYPAVQRYLRIRSM